MVAATALNSPLGSFPGTFSARAPVESDSLARMVRANLISDMKAFLQHDENGLFYQGEGAWVSDPQEALAFLSANEAEQFRHARHIQTAHAVLRIDPALLTRSVRAPGVYQVGE